MLIVGISGKKQSGKDTLAADLQYTFMSTYKVGVRSFAGFLKSQCRKLFGLTLEQCYGTDADKNSLTDIPWCNRPGYRKGDNRLMTAREVMQEYGTMTRRINPYCWIDLCLDNIRDSYLDLVFITDVRFPNEVGAIQAEGGKVIRLTRAVGADQHVSETALDAFAGFDFMLDNVNGGPSYQVALAQPIVQAWLTAAA